VIKASKHPQTIFTVEAQPFVQALNLQPGFNRVDEGQFMEALYRNHILGLRDVLDNKKTTLEDVVAQINYIADLHGIQLEFINPPPLVEYAGDRTKLQLLPYRVLRSKTAAGHLFSRYQRGKGVGESRLAGNDSIGYGGHMDWIDYQSEAMTLANENPSGMDEFVTEEQDSTLDVVQTLKLSAHREFLQEVKLIRGERDVTDELANSIEFNLAGLIWDHSNDVGHLHLGIVLIGDLPEDVTAVPREAELLPREPQYVDELLANEAAESWTSIVARAVADCLIA